MNANLLIVTSGGLGFLKPAPGTWGSLPPCALLLLGVWFAPNPIVAHLIMAVIAIVASFACIGLGSWAEEAFGGKDPSPVVIDEVAGMALSLAFIPLDPLGTGHWISPFIVIGAAFVLFRIVDIIKPPPANSMQQFPAGWGILLDDLFAGVYVNVVMQVFLRLGLPALAGLERAAG